MTFLELVESKRKITKNGCWLMRVNGDRMGYARIYNDNILYTQLHRRVYEEVYGKLKKEDKVSHTCNYKNCCNPAHLVVNDAIGVTANAIKQKRHVSVTKNFRHLSPNRKDALILDLVSGSYTLYALHKKYGITLSAVSWHKRNLKSKLGE